MKLRVIISLAIPLVILLLALLVGSILLLRLFFVSALITGIAYIWPRLSLKNLQIEIGKAPEHLQVGDSFQREVTITNQGKFPRQWLKLHDNTNLPGHRDTLMASIPGQGRFSWQTSFNCRTRGLYQLGPTSITVSDLFGIYSSQRTLGEPQDIIIYPATVELPLFRFASFSDFGYGSGFQSISRISPNASSVREYASGDSLQHIHWKSTARTGNLMVKMFDADRSYNAAKTAWVLLDINEDSHFGREDKGSEEQAITIAASVAKKYLQGGMRVGMMACDEKKTFISTERGEEHLWEILKALALIKGDWKTKLSDIVLERLDNFRDNPLVIIVATSASDGLMEIVHQLRNRVDSVVIVMLDISSFGGRHPAGDMSRVLTWSGAQVYTVRRGEELAKTLDSKTTRIHPMMV